MNQPCGQSHILEQGVFASASRSLLRARRAAELFEMVHSVINKLPKPPSDVSIWSSRNKPVSSSTDFFCLH